MAKRLVSIGPWKRGLNKRASSDLIRDDELSEAYNVVVRSDGTIAPRPGFRHIKPSQISGFGTLRTGSSPDRGERIDVLGIINDYFLVAKANWNTTTSKWETTKIFKAISVANYTTMLFTWTDTGWVAPADKPYIVKVIPYVNDVYFIPNYYGTTLHYAVNSVTSLNFSALTSASLPQGLFYEPYAINTIGGPSPKLGYMTSPGLSFVWKDRLFICYKDRIYYSQATNFTVWDTSPGLGGFFDVGTDGTNDFNYITGIVLSGDALYIFKPQGTYGFTFQTDPGTDGYLRVISDTKGATSVVEWNNRIFTVDQVGVYEFVSGQFIDIANQLNLSNSAFNTQFGTEYSWRTMTSLGGTAQLINVLSDFLVVGPLVRENGANADISGHYFAMNLNNGAWSEWDVFGSKLYNFDDGDTDTATYLPGFIGPMYTAGWNNYYMGTSYTGKEVMIMNFSEDERVIDDGAVTGSPTRLPKYYIETKEFSFGNDVAFKKVYRIQANRSIGIDENNPTASIDDTNRRGGFGAYYTTPVDKAADLDQRTKVQSLFMDHYGNVRVGSTFRCTSFSLFYDFHYANQDTMSISQTLSKFYFRIDGFNVYVDQRADFANMQSLASS